MSCFNSFIRCEPWSNLLSFDFIICNLFNTASEVLSESVFPKSSEVSLIGVELECASDGKLKENGD